VSPTGPSGADDSSALAGLEEFLSPGRVAGVFAVVVAAVFLPVLFANTSFVLRDYSVFGYPLAHYHREVFWSGEIPLWNPLSYAGIPFAAQWNTMVFYPGSLIYLLFPLPWSLSIFCVIHLYLAGLGMYFLVRHWTESGVAGVIAGIAFAFSGLLQNSLMWPNNIAALGWLPWVLWMVQLALARGGRDLIFAILAGSMQMLTGAPEVILFTWLLVGVLWIVEGNLRQTGTRLGIIIASVSVLCAIQLLPFLDLLLISERAGVAQANDWAMDFDGWVNFFAPLYETRTKGIGAYYHDTQAWTHSYFVGVPVIWLSLVALFADRGRRTWAVGGLLLLGTWLAMGADGWLYSIVAKIPPLSMVRYPVKLVIVTTVAFALLAGLGVRALSRGAAIRMPTIVTAVLCGLAFLMIRDVEGPGAVPRSQVMGNLMLRLLLGAGVIVLLPRLLKSKPMDLRILLGVSGILVVDFVTHQPAVQPTIDREWYQQPNPTLATFSEMARAGQTRVHPSKSRQIQNLYSADAPLKDAFLLARISMFNNWNLVEGTAKLNGFYSLWTPEQEQIAQALMVDPQDVPQGLADFLGIEFFSPVENTFEWHHRPSARSIVGIGAAPVQVEAGQTLARLTAADFDPSKTVFVIDESVEAQASSAAVVTNVVRLRDKVYLRAQTDVPTMLTVAQSFHPNWRAEIDGEPVDIHRANLGFQAIVVPAGEHEIVFRYQDRAFAWGRWITLAGLIGLAVAWRREKEK